MLDAAMTNPVGKTDYKVRRTPDKPAPVPEDAGAAAIVDFLQLLGRAARQFHTYPATSPLCTDAIDECLCADDDSRLGSAEELVAAEAADVHADGDGRGDGGVRSLSRAVKGPGP